MRHRLFTILAALSLLLFVAVCALWARGYFVTDHVSYGRYRVRPDGATSYFRVYSLAGRGSAVIGVAWSSSGVRPDTPPSMVGWSHTTAGPADVGAGRASYGGFGGHWYTVPVASASRYGEVNICFPLWFLVAVLAATPFYALLRWLRRAHPAGHCRRCGYDLRATPGRCPECGDTPTPAGATE